MSLLVSPVPVIQEEFVNRSEKRHMKEYIQVKKVW